MASTTTTASSSNSSKQATTHVSNKLSCDEHEEEEEQVMMVMMKKKKKQRTYFWKYRNNKSRVEHQTAKTSLIQRTISSDEARTIALKLNERTSDAQAFMRYEKEIEKFLEIMKKRSSEGIFFLCAVWFHHLASKASEKESEAKAEKSSSEIFFLSYSMIIGCFTSIKCSSGFKGAHQNWQRCENDEVFSLQS